MTEEVILKSWGFEQILHNNGYCCKLLVYQKAVASSLHYHEKKHETFYVASGLFEIETRTDYGRHVKSVACGPGFSAVIPPYTQHRIRCVEVGTIVEASSHDDPNDCVRLIPSET